MKARCCLSIPYVCILGDYLRYRLSRTQIIYPRAGQYINGIAAGAEPVCWVLDPSTGGPRYHFVPKRDKKAGFATHSNYLFIARQGTLNATVNTGQVHSTESLAFM